MAGGEGGLAGCVYTTAGPPDVAARTLDALVHAHHHSDRSRLNTQHTFTICSVWSFSFRLTWANRRPLHRRHARSFYTLRRGRTDRNNASHTLARVCLLAEYIFIVVGQRGRPVRSTKQSQHFCSHIAHSCATRETQFCHIASSTFNMSLEHR